MKDFFIKILIAMIVMIIFCYNVTNQGIFPSLNSGYDDINLSENIYESVYDTTEDAIESVDKATENHNYQITEKLYTGVPRFLRDLFNTINEGIHSWDEEALDVDGLKQDTESLLEKLFKIFPYTE